MKIKVRYRNKWYWASSLSIDKNGNISFEYLHELDGAVDSEHVQATVLYLDHVEMELVKKGETEKEFVQCDFHPHDKFGRCLTEDRLKKK